MTSTSPLETLGLVACLLAGTLFQRNYRLKTKTYNKTDDFNLPIIKFPLYVATFQQYLHMEYIPFS
jgi:hypothetical protein